MNKTYDILVIGGGLSGFACAVKAARNGKQVLLVERRPALGWESTWACQLDFSGQGNSVAKSILNTIGKVGGFTQERADAPILEMALDRLADKAGVDVLLYSYPVRLIHDGNTAFGVVMGNKSGEQVLKAKVIVDATEETILWRQTAQFRNHPVNQKIASKHVIFFNHSEGAIKLPMALDNGIRLYPSVWKNEVVAEFTLDQCDILAANNRIPPVITSVRENIPQLKDALVSHVAHEPFPFEPMIHLDHSGMQHPDISNLFAAGIWTSASDNTPVGRLNRGEEAGEIASKCKGAKRFPDEMMTGAALMPPSEHAADVIVVGGGTGGAIAGIAAGREGVRTILIETSPILGGIGTGGAITGYYYGIKGGIQDEVDERVKNMSPLFTGKWTMPDHACHPEVKKIVLQQMLAEAHVEVRLNTVVTGVVCKDSACVSNRPVATTALSNVKAHGRKRLAGVIAAGPGGRVSVYSAKTFVDGTGDGDVAVMAGAPFQVGRERDNLMHAFSQPCGYLDGENGHLRYRNFDAGYVDPTDIVDLTRGRRLGINHFWRDRFNGQNRLLYLAPLIGLRQSRQIMGEYQLTLADEISGRRFDDAVSYTSAHYDNHGWDYENDSDQAALWVWALGNWGKVIGCEVPYRCLVPQIVDGLLLACRAISATYDAHMAFRMQRDIQRIGEVAGMAAAMSSRKNILPRDIDIKELQSVLKKRGFLDEKYRPKPAMPARRPRKLPAAPGLSGEKINELAWRSTVNRGSKNALALGDMLNSENADVRFKSSAALAFMGNNDGVHELVKRVVERSPDKAECGRAVPTWQAAIPFLGMAGDKSAVPALLNVLEDKKTNLDALVAALRALGRINDVAAIPVICELLRRKDLPDKRTLASDDGHIVPKPVIDDAKWQIKLAAAETLIKISGSQDIIRRVIKPHLEDKRAYVRRYANKLMDTLTHIFH